MKEVYPSPLVTRQLTGAFILFLVVVTAIALPIAAKPLRPLFQAAPPPLVAQLPGTTAVKVDLEGGAGGIFFFETTPLVQDVLYAVAPEKVRLFKEQGDLLSRELVSGERLAISFNPAQIDVSPMEAQTRFALGMTMDINRATVEDLALISGIGPATAASIVEYRDLQGGFQSLGELKNVRGIGNKRYAELKRHLVLDRENGW